MAWFVIIGLNTTMGVAWHRFTVWPNIWFKRESSGRPALGALPPIIVDGKPLDFAEIEDLDEDASLGVGKVEDFTWKGLLDFTSCTECGRCQSQCPAWNTEKPLSPKLLIMDLREHAYAKAPYLQAAEAARDEACRERSAPRPDGRWSVRSRSSDGVAGVIDPDVLWSCTTCGACVQQCPVDIEHVDHILDMRRFQVMMESEFPSELNGLFKGLENKGNPWSMSPRGRMDWAKDLDFDVPGGRRGRRGSDRGRLPVLGRAAPARTTTGPRRPPRPWPSCCTRPGSRTRCWATARPAPATRPAGRATSSSSQQLAMENVETLTEAKATKIVTACAHCLNTLKNEYPQFGVELRGRAPHPAAQPAGPRRPADPGRSARRARWPGARSPSTTRATSGGTTRSTTRRGNCSARCPARPSPRCRATGNGRSAAAPAAPGCGWRRRSAPGSTSTGPRRRWPRRGGRTLGSQAIATGCPFCRVMLSDGLTAKQADGAAPRTIEVHRRRPTAAGVREAKERATPM